MIIGRKKEQSDLLRLVESDEPQFCAVYGRRRVGKTYLIRETFGYKFTFQHVGVANASMKRQLSAFRNSLRDAGLENCNLPKDWFDAFEMLQRLVEQSSDRKKIIYLDELSWMDTPKSNFISALEHFWNGWATARPEKDIVLIVCGSATSWIVNKIMKNRGGLHNRLTESIQVQPFTLSECEQYVQVQDIPMSRKDIVEAYMALGGIPYYWSLMRRGESLAQNMDRLFFADDGKLRNEFEELYASLFKRPEPYIAIVEALATKKIGMSRDEVSTMSGVKNSGMLTKMLKDLEQCGFIRRYQAFDKKKYGATYQLIDNFTLFYYRFLRVTDAVATGYWSSAIDRPEISAWKGLAFERVCLWHIPQIKKTLGISGIVSSEYSWRTSATDEHDGAQIDLLIDRSDNVVNVCEIKFSSDEFSITKPVEQGLRRKLSVFKQVSATRKSVHLTMITTYGVERNEYSNLMQSQITMDDLFC